MPGIVKQYGTALIALTGALLAYNAANILAAASSAKARIAAMAKMAVTKLQIALNYKATAATALYGAAMSLLAGNIKGAAYAFQIFSKALLANPIGLVIAGITGLIVAIRSYDKHNAESMRVEREKQNLQKSLTASQDTMNKAYEEYGSQINKLAALSRQEKIDLQEKINKTLELAKANLAVYEAKRLQIEQDSTKASFWQQLWNRTKNFGNLAAAVADDVEDAMKNGAGAVERFKAPIDELKTTIENLEGQQIDLSNILNAEGLGDAIGTGSISELEEKLNKYNLALRNVAIGSEDYIRVQKKVAETEKMLKAIRETPDSLLSDKEQKAVYQRELDLLEKSHNEQQAALIRDYLARKITKAQFDAEILKAEQKFLSDKIELNKKYSKDYSALGLEQQRNALKTAEERTKMFKDAEKVMDRHVNEVDKALKDFLKKSNKEFEDWLEKSNKDSADALQDEIEEEIEATIKMFEEAQKVREKYRGVDIEAQRNAELAAIEAEYEFFIDSLEAKREAGLLSEEEFNADKLRLDKQYADDSLRIWSGYISEKVNYYGQFVGMASQAFNAMSDARFARLEADKERELSMAGNNEEQRSQIEEKYAQKKLDLEKQAADTRFAIRIAEIIASTAMAIMTCYAQLGPIAGSFAAGLVTALGVAQGMIAKAERDKVKNMTLQGSAGGSGKTAKRVIVPGKEDGGRIEVEREQDGKRFVADVVPELRGYADKPTVIVGESGEEFVVNAEAARNPTIRPALDIIDVAQKSGAASSINLPKMMVRGRESGGFLNDAPTPGAGATGGGIGVGGMDYSELTKVIKDLSALLTALKRDPLKAYVVLSELNAKQELQNKANRLGSRR